MTNKIKSPANTFTKEDVFKTIRDLAIFAAPIIIYALEQFSKEWTINPELLYAFAMSTLVAWLRRYVRQV